MKVLIDISFEKDIEKITSKTTKRSVAKIMEKLIEADSLFDISNCKKNERA